MSEARSVEKIEATCPHCEHKFEHRRFQKIVTCPSCRHRIDARIGDRHAGQGLYLRASEQQKDMLERLAFESGRSQAELVREALDLLFEKWSVDG